MKRAIIIVAILSLVACASNPADNWIINTNPSLPREVIDFPQLGQITTGELGRTLAAWGVRSERPAIELLKPWQYVEESTLMPAFTFKAGIGPLSATATHKKTNETWECFSFDYVRGNNWLSDDAGLPSAGKADLCRRGNEFKDFGHLLIPDSPNRRPFDVEFVETAVDDFNAPTDVQEFVYNGRVGDAVKFVYREFKNNYARPAFTQDVQYDLSQSDEIGFLNLRLRVLEATNTSITYVVTRNFIGD